MSKSKDWGFPRWLSGKESACQAGDVVSVLGSGIPPEEGNDNPLQYSCLENSMDGGAGRATVHKVAKSWTRLKRPIDLAHTHRKETCEVRGSHVIFRNLFSTHTRYHLEELRVLWRTYWGTWLLSNFWFTSNHIQSVLKSSKIHRCVGFCPCNTVCEFPLL